MKSERILVVDDERTARVSLAEILRMEGYEVVAVEGGDAAVLFLKAQDFDVVLCDLKMPDVNGLEVLSACKEYRPATEFVLLTAYGTLDTAVDALRHGACDYLLKPISALFSVIRLVNVTYLSPPTVSMAVSVISYRVFNASYFSGVSSSARSVGSPR